MLRCTHASAIGKLDEEELFYLMSRGIPRKTAVEMSVQGFFDPLMRRIPYEGIRDRIFGRIVDENWLMMVFEKKCGCICFRRGR